MRFSFKVQISFRFIHSFAYRVCKLQLPHHNHHRFRCHHRFLIIVIKWYHYHSTITVPLSIPSDATPFNSRCSMLFRYFVFANHCALAPLFVDRSVLVFYAQKRISHITKGFLTTTLKGFPYSDYKATTMRFFLF